MLIYPSMLSADHTRLGEELVCVERAGADAIHWDIMDGSFVENIAFGHNIVAAHRRLSSLRFDVHLMVKDPEKHMQNFSRAGADAIIIHYEACNHFHDVISRIKSLGLKAGAALNPATHPGVLEYCASMIDIVVVMGVSPGMAGQCFIRSQLKKISELKKILPASTEICVDGGITDQTVKECRKHGADSFVSGSYIFGSSNYFDAIASLKKEF